MILWFKPREDFLQSFLYVERSITFLMGQGAMLTGVLSKAYVDNCWNLSHLIGSLIIRLTLSLALTQVLL